MIRPDIVPSLFAAVSALGLTSSTLAAQRRLFPNDSSVQAILNEQVTAKMTAGIVVGLLDADGTRRVLAAGKADNKDLVLDGNTVFEIGSITKTFTASLLADMVARGEVKLSDRVQQYLPASVKIPARNGREITLLDLVTVSSGLPGMPSNFKPADPGNPYADYTVQQMYEFLSGYTLPRDIGSKYEYSNLGMGLLGHTLALKAGKSYYDLLNDRILKPLRMGDTEIILSPRLERRLALGHDKNGKVVPNWDLPTLAGAGAIRSTVNDMFKYLAAHLDSTSRPLGKVLATTHTARTETGNPGLTVGMAWHILKSPGGSIVWHNGGTGGYRTFMGFDESKRIGVIVLTNSSISADDVGLHLIDPAIPLSKPPVARVAHLSAGAGNQHRRDPRGRGPLGRRHRPTESPADRRVGDQFLHHRGRHRDFVRQGGWGRHSTDPPPGWRWVPGQEDPLTFRLSAAAWRRRCPTPQGPASA